jgi:ABC-2 type transport system permease protein
MYTYSMSDPWMIVEELAKQYTLVEVDSKQPIKEKFDALLAVQPSAMGYEEILHFVAAIRGGQPTIIFEDPLPVYPAQRQSIPGTSQPRQSMGRQSPKGNLDLLWGLLGVQIDGTQIVWQEYRPIRQLPLIPKGFVFLDRSLEKGQKKISPFNKDDAVTSALQYMLLPMPGRITEYIPMVRQNRDNPLTVTPLLTTFHQPAGTVLTRFITYESLRGGTWESSASSEAEPHNLAVRIRGERPALPVPMLLDGETPVRPKPTDVHVILVADIDMLSDELFKLRQIGNEPEAGINLNFDSVTFVLNAIDSVAGDERFLEVRSRRSKHRTLSKFDEHTESFRQKTADAKKNLEEQFREAVMKETKSIRAQIELMEAEINRGAVSIREADRKIAMEKRNAEKRLNTKVGSLELESIKKQEELDVRLNEDISRVQGQYKLWSVVLPPIPPLLIAFTVFFVRRIRESVGIPLSRRRK